MLQLLPVGPNARNWSSLAERYAGKSEPEVKRHAMCVHIGWVSYSSCVCVGTSKAGLSMRVDPPFHWLGDPELLIPWCQIKSLGRRGLFGGGILLYIKKPRMKIHISIGILGGLPVIREIERHCGRKTMSKEMEQPLSSDRRAF